MKSARFPIYLFEDKKRLNPMWSSWTCFCEAIKGKNELSKRTIKKYFLQLVDKGDYVKSELFQLLGYLYDLASL